MSTPEYPSYSKYNKLYFLFLLNNPYSCFASLLEASQRNSHNILEYVYELMRKLSCKITSISLNCGNCDDSSHFSLSMINLMIKSSCAKRDLSQFHWSKAHFSKKSVMRMDYKIPSRMCIIGIAFSKTEQ